MANRHEEKYIIDYHQYTLLRSRAMDALTPDPHTTDGSYVITSLYYDDPLDTALDEKLDGLSVHSKFRIRTYDFSDKLINLERKDKFGIQTRKYSAPISKEQIEMLNGTATDIGYFHGNARYLATEICTKQLLPSVAVRYTRDAFVFAGTDLRLTFDTQLEAIGPTADALFSWKTCGIPVLDGNSVIMEIKYGKYLPSFVRKMTDIDCSQLSVSKYALCRERLFI